MTGFSNNYSAQNERVTRWILMNKGAEILLHQQENFPLIKKENVMVIWNNNQIQTHITAKQALYCRTQRPLSSQCSVAQQTINGALSFT